jgi:hypothetical protein
MVNGRTWQGSVNLPPTHTEKVSGKFFPRSWTADARYHGPLRDFQTVLPGWQRNRDGTCHQAKERGTECAFSH